MKKLTTPGGLRWTRDRVRIYRGQRAIRGPKKAQRDDSMTMNQVMEHLGIGHNGVLGLACYHPVLLDEPSERRSLS